MGKHKYIETPQKMWELFQNYKEQVKSKPRIKVEHVGKDATRVETPLEVPLTIEGFSNYLRREDITTNLHDYLANTNDAYNEYSSICRAIKEVIRQDQIEGGMVGQYNPSITQRLNGLAEKRETDLKANVNILNIDPLSENE